MVQRYLQRLKPFKGKWYKSMLGVLFEYSVVTNAKYPEEIVSNKQQIECKVVK